MFNNPIVLSQDYGWTTGGVRLVYMNQKYWRSDLSFRGGGHGGQAQYEMLNSKLVLLNILKFILFLKWRIKSLIIWKSYKVLFNPHYKGGGGQSLIWKLY